MAINEIGEFLHFGNGLLLLVPFPSEISYSTHPYIFCEEDIH